MSDEILIEFTNSGARIIRDPNIISIKKQQDNVLLNPDTSHLSGISPSFWKKDGKAIVSMDRDELTKAHAYSMGHTKIETITNKDIEQKQQLSDIKKKNEAILTTRMYKLFFCSLTFNILTALYLLYKGFH